MSKKWFYLFCRIGLGLTYVVFGLNGFFYLLPVPPLQEEATVFLKALIDTGYMLPFWKGVEVITGFMFIANYRVPLALLLATPVTLNIIAFHVFLDPPGIPISLILALFTFGIAHQNWSKYKPLLEC